MSLEAKGAGSRLAFWSEATYPQAATRETMRGLGRTIGVLVVALGAVAAWVVILAIAHLDHPSPPTAPPVTFTTLVYFSPLLVLVAGFCVWLIFLRQAPRAWIPITAVAASANVATAVVGLRSVDDTYAVPGFVGALLLLGAIFAAFLGPIVMLGAVARAEKSRGARLASRDEF